MVAIEEMKGGQPALDPLFATARSAPDPAEWPREGSEALPAAGGQLETACATIELEIGPLLEAAGEPQSPFVDPLLLVRGALTGQHQRGPGFVDQNAVGLVDDGEAETAKQQLLGSRPFAVKAVELVGEAARALRRDAVSQVIEGDLITRGVGDVAGVGGSSRIGILLRAGDGSHGQAERLVDRPHGLGVTRP
jgi:hypothetical protein